TYRARLVVGEWSSEVPFEVLADPRSSATQEDLEAQFDFVLGVRDRLTEIHEAIAGLRRARGDLEALETRVGKDDAKDGEDAAHPELAAAVSTLLADLDSIEKALYQTQNQSPQDPLNFPVRLNDKLGALLRLASIGENRPTDSMVQVRDQLEAAVNEQLNRLSDLWRDRLPEINRLAREAEIPAVRPPAPPED
ncbi:MAG: glycosyl hydrolase, partial [Acidobacteria bacterium]|nr:glycosyl hydrolase [Acidobacteriota bacterium]